MLGASCVKLGPAMPVEQKMPARCGHRTVGKGVVPKTKI